MTSSVSGLFIVFGLWLTLSLLCCGGGRYSDSQTYKVTYRVDGSDRASLTYTNATGGTEQHEVKLPWQVSFDSQAGEHLYLSAQDRGQNYGITTSISVNGRVVKDATSTEKYGIATVNTLCCRE